jgi:hypothetical protein
MEIRLDSQAFFASSHRGGKKVNAGNGEGMVR